MQKSARFSETSTMTLLEHERNYRQHLSRLVDISSTKGPFAIKHRNILEHESMLQKKQEYARRKQTKHLNDLEKSNLKLLTRLMEINIGKGRTSSKSQPKTLVSVSETERSMQNENTPIGTSHNNNRKKEVVRIVNENTKISERLVLKESNFSQEKMLREYNQTRGYSNIMRRIRIRSDKTLEIGQGTIKYSKDLRIISHNSYLPPLNPQSSQNLRALSVSRINTESHTNSCRSTGKFSQVPSTARQRIQTLNTEPDITADNFRGLERCNSSPNFQPMFQLNESILSAIQAKNEMNQGQNLSKYRHGQYLFPMTQENAAKSFERATTLPSKENGSFIQEESQTKEESVQQIHQSCLENYDSKQTCEVQDKKDSQSSKSTNQVEVKSEEYEQIFESLHESSKVQGKESEKEPSKSTLNNQEIEEDIDYYNSLSESQKGTN